VKVLGLPYPMPLGVSLTPSPRRPTGVRRSR
jgi:hypothetical protein